MTTNRFDITLAAQIELTERFALAIITGDFARGDDELNESLKSSVERIWRVAAYHAEEAIKRRATVNE